MNYFYYMRLPHRFAKFVAFEISLYKISKVATPEGMADHKRKQRNASARARYRAYRDCSMVRTRYGNWE